MSILASLALHSDVRLAHVLFHHSLNSFLKACHELICPLQFWTPQLTPRLPGQIPRPPAQACLSSHTHPTYSVPLIGFQTVPICHTITPVILHPSCTACSTYSGPQPLEAGSPTHPHVHLHDVCIDVVIWLHNMQPLIIQLSSIMPNNRLMDIFPSTLISHPYHLVV